MQEIRKELIKSIQSGASLERPISLVSQLNDIFLKADSLEEMKRLASECSNYELVQAVMQVITSGNELSYMAITLAHNLAYYKPSSKHSSLLISLHLIFFLFSFASCNYGA